MHQGIYELTEVISPYYDGGDMLVATTEHQDNVYDYTLGFINDCFTNEKEPVERPKRWPVDIFKMVQFFYGRIPVVKLFQWHQRTESQKMLPQFHWFTHLKN